MPEDKKPEAKQPENPMPTEGALLIMLDALNYAREAGAFKDLDWDSTGALASAIHKIRREFKLADLEKAARAAG